MQISGGVMLGGMTMRGLVASGGGGSFVTKLVIGSSWATGNAIRSGAAYIYDIDGSNEVKIIASDGATEDNFGATVASGEEKIVVGAYGADANGNDSGAVYIYNIDGTNEIQLSATGNSSNDFFGRSVSMSGDKVIVGASRDSNFTGKAYVYDLDGSNEIVITASDGAVSDNFGSSVAIG